MSRKYLHIGLLVLARAMVAAACGGGTAETTTTAAATTTTAAPSTSTTEATTTTAAPSRISCGDGITIGVITDQTGALAIYGAHMMRGVPVGFEYATGAPADGDTYMLDDCPVTVLYRDDQSNADMSATAARELVENAGAQILIGTVSSGVTATLQEIAADDNVILIAAPAAANDITGATFNPNTFRASRNNYQDGIAICQYLTQDYHNFVQIAPDYSFGYGGAQAYRDACTYFGGEFVADDVFAPADTTDFTPYLEPFVNVDADALLVTWAGGGFVPLLQAATDLGLLDHMKLGSPFVDNLVMPVFFANAIGTTSTIIYHYTLPNNPINDFLVAKDMEYFQTYPDLFDADGMNAAIMAIEALRATGGMADADSLRAVLEGMSFDGPKGTIYVRPEDHVAIQDMYVVTLLNVTDPEYKYYQYVTTLRPEPPCLLQGEYLARCGDLPAGSLSG
jgi:branched-chain amino acid transport system substrate-binding protein